MTNWVYVCVSHIWEWGWGGGWEGGWERMRERDRQTDTHDLENGIYKCSSSSFRCQLISADF